MPLDRNTLGGWLNLFHQPRHTEPLSRRHCRRRGLLGHHLGQVAGVGGSQLPQPRKRFVCATDDLFEPLRNGNSDLGIS